MTGWVVDSAADTITFNVAPPVGVNNIVVKETATSAINATDVWAFGAWNIGFGYPSEVEFFSDRLCWANSRRQPQTIWMSKSGAYIDYGKNVPLLDEDAITITINARQVNAITELVPLSDLLVCTRSAEWKLSTGADEVVAPGKVGFKPQTFWGCSYLPAVVVGESALFIQRSGNVVRDVAFTFTDDKYKGNNLSIYANHLVEDFQIVDLAYQQHPYSCLWMVRSDGKLVSMTYVREQEVVGWALHDTQGLVKRVCVVPENNVDVVYITVVRTVGGVAKLYTERMLPRNLADQRDAFFVDSGLTYDGRAQPGTMKVGYGLGPGGERLFNLTASLPSFVLGVSDVGDVVRLRVPVTTIVNGEAVEGFTIYRLQITVVYSTTIAEVTALSEPDDLALWDVLSPSQVTYTDWEWARGTISGFGHLEGMAVSVLADAQVVEDLVVTAGAIELPEPAAVVHVGLGYQSILESLDINVPGNETVRERPKMVNRVTLLVKDTRGLKSGPDMTDDTLDDFKVREFEAYEDPLALLSGIMDVNVVATWDRNGRFVVVQDYPLPATILSMIPDVGISGVG